MLIFIVLLACFTDWTFRILFFCGDLTGNTVIHLDKALTRIREYERMKLKADFNHCNTSAAGLNSCEVSNAERASANPAEPEEGTWSTCTCAKTFSSLVVTLCFFLFLF